MSLVVWLPLTKDLRQQGLSDVEAINNGATYSSTGGKLGGCYSFTTSSYQKIGFPYSLANYTEFTVCVWVKPISTTITGCLFTFVNPNDYWQFVITNGNNVGIRDNSSGEAGSRKEYTLGSFVANVWTHLAISYDKGVVKIYKDGVLFSTNNTGGSAMNNYSGTNAAIGESMVSSSSYYFAGSVNDFRLYDHCLSPMEVKQISQGLVLHYPLNREGWGQENLLKNSNFLQGTNGFEGYTAQSATCTKQEDCMKVVSTSASGGFYTSNFNAITTGDMTTFSADVKANSNMTIYIGTDGSGNGNCQAYTVGTSWQRISISKAKTTNNANLRIYGNGTFYTKNLKYELGSIATPWCPNSSDELATTMGLNEATEYDTSGFCNNGTRIGTFTWTSDTPKYSVSQYFNGSAYVQADPLSSEVKTVSCWVKTDKPSTNQFYWCDTGTKMCLATYNGHGTVITWYQNGGQSTGSKCTLSGSEWKSNDWNHFVVVDTGNGTRDVYCNGEKLTPMSDDWFGTSGSKLVIGNRGSGAAPLYGYVSDFRAYVTQLSESDIKALYQNSAYIATDGTMYAYDFVES